jgi:hypothetical protein
MVLFCSVLLGRVTAKALGPSKREIIDGVPYANTVLWEMLWAANGLYDHHSAHWFTKSGGLRSKRVEEAIGLPASISHCRHSAEATEKIYKPAVLNMFKERPGYAYATAHIRLYNHGLSFYKYTYGGYKVWETWLKDGFGANEIISGETVFGLTPERENIRYSRAWKISPLVLLTKFVQGGVTRVIELGLIIASLIGAFIFRRVDFVVFFFGCFVAKMLFSNGVHALTRYMNFVNVLMILGLAAFTLSLINSIVSYKMLRPQHKKDIEIEADHSNSML